MRIVISGATGLIGTALTASLAGDGIEVTRLVRRPPAGPGEVRWDPPSPLDPAVLSGCDGVVHLSGAPVAGGRLDPGPQAGAAGQPGGQHGHGGQRHRRRGGAAAGAAVRLGDRLVRPDRRPGGQRGRPGGPGVPGRAGPRLGGGRRPRDGGRHPGGDPAQRAGPGAPRRPARPAAAAVPAGPGRPPGRRPPVPELDRAGRPHPGHPVPARPGRRRGHGRRGFRCRGFRRRGFRRRGFRRRGFRRRGRERWGRRRRGRRAWDGAVRGGQPDRAGAGHQRLVHSRAGPGRAPPGPVVGARAGAAGRAGRAVHGAAGQRPGPAGPPAGGRFTFRYPASTLPWPPR